MSTKLRNFITATAIVAIIASVIYLTISSVLKHKDYVVKHADSYVISFAIRNNEPDYAASISHETSNGKSIRLGAQRCRHRMVDIHCKRQTVDNVRTKRNPKQVGLQYV